MNLSKSLKITRRRVFLLLIAAVLIGVLVWWRRPAPALALARAIEADDPAAIVAAIRRGADPSRMFVEQGVSEELRGRMVWRVAHETPLTLALQEHSEEAIRHYWE